MSDIQAGFRKGRGTRDQVANIYWMLKKHENSRFKKRKKKSREFRKNLFFCFIEFTKAFDYMDNKKLWKILEEMGIADHLTCLLRNLYAGQEATVRTRHGAMAWFKIGRGA